MDVLMMRFGICMWFAYGICYAYNCISFSCLLHNIISWDIIAYLQVNLIEFLDFENCI